ncbi:MAG: Ig-like domain-containing protein [Limisphaerales bacterium]
MYRLEVTDANNNTVSSSDATLTVLPDTIAPTIISTELNSKSDLLTVVFSEKVDVASAINTSHYSLNNGISLNSGTVSVDGVIVTFNVSGLAPGQSGFLLSVSGVTDRYHNAIAPITLPSIWSGRNVQRWTGVFHGG